MTVAQQAPPAEFRQRPGAPPPNGRWAGFTHLLMARMKELKREPEVVFWVFVFPILLALGLGIAFRNKPADVTSVVIVPGQGTENVLAMIQHSPRSASIRARTLDEPAALQGLRLGKFDMVMLPDGKGGLEYRYDPARPESVLSHAEVDDVLQAGRVISTF
jgi:ABC-2 type transport system permease protein